MRSMPPTSATASVAPAESSLPDIARTLQARDLLLSTGPRYHLTGEQLTQELRLRVLEGEEIDAEEMLLIVNDIRRDRRAAARTPAASSVRRSRTEARPITTEDLRAILDQDDL